MSASAPPARAYGLKDDPAVRCWTRGAGHGRAHVPPATADRLRRQPAGRWRRPTPPTCWRIEIMLGDRNASACKPGRREPTGRWFPPPIVATGAGRRRRPTSAGRSGWHALASEAPAARPDQRGSVPTFMTAFDALLAATPLDDIKAYLRWHVLHQSADLLPKAFADANFDFFNRTLAGQQAESPRWRRCVAQTDARLGEALGKAFVEETFSPQAKADTLQMVQAIKDAMRAGHRGGAVDERRDQEGGHGQARRGRRDRIGYPESWRDYSSIRVTRGRCAGQLWSARSAFGAPARAGEDRPAGRPPGEGHDAADSQCLLQPEPQQHQLPRRHPAAAVLPVGPRRGGELRRGGRGHRPRADARLRRSGAQVRRTGQPARLVDRRRQHVAYEERGDPASPISIRATWSSATRTSTGVSRSGRTRRTTAGCGWR